MPRHVTKQEVISRFLSVHGNRYDYSRFVFTKIHGKALIVCKKHGEFLQRVSHHYSGSGCPYCGGSKSLTKGKYIDNHDGTYQIPITKGYNAIIDKSDFDVISSYSWQAKTGRSGRVYAKTSLKIKGRKINMLMHRVIMNESDPNIFIDHIDGNGLNNSRTNLRRSSCIQNSRNISVKRSNSGYKGVCFSKSTQKYTAYITIDKSRKHLGSFDNPSDAASCYDRAAKEHFGQFANLNF